MRSIDEAIEHAREAAFRTAGPCQEEHNQLADWLTELRSTRLLLRDLGLHYHESETQDGSAWVSFHPPPDYTATTWMGAAGAYKDGERTKAVIDRINAYLEKLDEH